MGALLKVVCVKNARTGVVKGQCEIGEIVQIVGVIYFTKVDKTFVQYLQCLISLFKRRHCMSFHDDTARACLSCMVVRIVRNLAFVVSKDL